MSYQLIEPFVVGAVLLTALLCALARWWPRQRRAGGCGSGCGGCSSGRPTCASPSENSSQRVAMPVSRRRPR